MKTLSKSKGVKPFRGKKADLFVEYFFDAMDTWNANMARWTEGKEEKTGEILESEAKKWAKRLWIKLK